MINTLILEDKIYTLNEQKDNNLFIVKDANNNIKWFSLDLYFNENLEDGMSPSMSINPIHPKDLSLENLNGFVFEVKSAEESYKREDTFYYYEHEPFENYILKIENFNEKETEVSIKGVTITDGYASPYLTKTFETHCIVTTKIK